MAPKSAAALVLLAAMIAGLAPPLQAQRGLTAVVNFLSLVDNECSGDNAMKSCAADLVMSSLVREKFYFPRDCCTALLKAVTSGNGTRTRCACRFIGGRRVPADVLGVDVLPRCQADSNGGVAGWPSKLKEFCRHMIIGPRN